jgi:hypothetical protein
MLPDDFVIGLLELLFFGLASLAVAGFAVVALIQLVTRGFSWREGGLPLAVIGSFGLAWAALLRAAATNAEFGQPLCFVYTWQVALAVCVAAATALAFRIRMPAWVRGASAVVALLAGGLLVCSFVHGTRTMG